MDISTVSVPNTIPYDIIITIPELPGCRGEAAVTFDDAATAVSALCKVLTAAERLALFAQYCGQCGQAWGWCTCGKGGVMEAGSELDTLVAEKVMEWHRERSDGRWEWRNAVDDYTGACADDIEDSPRWSPSTCIEDAWRVEEELGRRLLYLRYASELQQITKQDRDPAFINADMFTEPQLTYWLLLHATPYQRCLAALKALDYVPA